MLSLKTLRLAGAAMAGLAAALAPGGCEREAGTAANSTGAVAPANETAGTAGAPGEPGVPAAPSRPGEQPRRYVIGLVAKSSSNPVFLAAHTGAQDAARRIGQERGVEISIDWRTPAAEDAQKQAEYIEQLVNGGADGIAVSCSDAQALTLAINAAVDQGTPVVCFDSDAPQSKRFAYFGTDDVACGRQVGEEVARALNGEGVVAILAGNQNAPNLQKRVQGVKEALANHPGISILDTFYHRETAQDAVAKLEEVQTANPQIAGWAMVGGWPLFTENALTKVRQINPDVKIVAVDALEPQLAYLKSGQVEVLLAQQVYEWGTESVRLLMDKILDGKEPPGPIVTADLVRLTPEDADEYAKNWEKWSGQ